MLRWGSRKETQMLGGGYRSQLYKHHVEMNIRYASEAAAWKAGQCLECEGGVKGD